MADPETLTPGRFKTPVDPDAVAQAWRGRGFSCHDFVDPPGRAWTDFVHATAELVTVVSGELELEIEGDRVVAGPDDEVFIPARARHTVRNIHNGTTRWLFGYD